jgi:RNA polymerase sigma-70 factor (ECF subfamily)
MPEIKDKSHETKQQDEELLRLLLSGNQEAFNTVVASYQRLVFKLGYQFFHNRDDALEIVQDTFLRLFENLPKLDPTTSLKYWIYRVATNSCIDQYRKHKRKRKYHQEWQSFYDENPSEAFNPETIMEQQNLREIIRENMIHLSKRQKLIFVMKHFNGLKMQEISTILEISVGTVKSLHHRAIKTLKRNISINTGEVIT